MFSDTELVIAGGKTLSGDFTNVVEIYNVSKGRCQHWIMNNKFWEWRYVEGVGKDYDSVAEASSRPVAIAPRDICMINAMFKNMNLLSFILSYHPVKVSGDAVQMNQLVMVWYDLHCKSLS